jgi:hypothetical protein
MRTTLALLAALFIGVTAAQTAKPAAEASKPAAEAAPPAPQETKPEAKPPQRAARKATSRRHLDARHCLEKPSNTEIIKCAEAYL